MRKKGEKQNNFGFENFNLPQMGQFHRKSAPEAGALFF
jgi:hypothetical protein